MARTTYTWVLISAFALASLPGAGVLAHRSSRACCSSRSCCEAGHCPMGSAHSGMPPDCRMHKHARCCAIGCSCMISPAPVLAPAPVHTYLYIDPQDRNAVPVLAAASWLPRIKSPAILAGHPPAAGHPPRSAL